MNLNLTDDSSITVLEKLDALPPTRLVAWVRVPNTAPNLAISALYIDGVAANLFMVLVAAGKYALAIDSTKPLAPELA